MSNKQLSLLINKDLYEQVVQIVPKEFTTQRAIVEFAFQELLRKNAKSKLNFNDLKDFDLIADDYDYKSMRLSKYGDPL